MLVSLEEVRDGESSWWGSNSNSKNESLIMETEDSYCSRRCLVVCDATLAVTSSDIICVFFCAFERMEASATTLSHSALVKVINVVGGACLNRKYRFSTASPEVEETPKSSLSLLGDESGRFMATRECFDFRLSRRSDANGESATVLSERESVTVLIRSYGQDK